MSSSHTTRATRGARRATRSTVGGSREPPSKPRSTLHAAPAQAVTTALHLPPRAEYEQKALELNLDLQQQAKTLEAMRAEYQQVNAGKQS